MISDVVLGLLGAAVALSGWGTLWYQHWIAKPKLGGSIIQVIRAQMSRPGASTSGLTSFLGFVALTNLRLQPNQILDFELSAQTHRGWQSLERVFQDHDGGPIAIQFGATTVQIPRSRFLNRTGQLSHGQSLAGFVLFYGPADLLQAEIHRYKLTLIDVFGARHVVEVEPSAFRSPHLMAELSGVDFSGAIELPPAFRQELPRPTR